MDTEHKIVLGLDFGTTFTGIAYGSTAGDVQDLEVITNWPDSSGASYKTPTKIAYHDENIAEEDDNDKWGFQVSGRMNCCAWFKLHLKTELNPRKYDDMSFDSLSRGILRLPEDRSAQEVCKDYLKLVWEFVQDVLEQRFTNDSLKLPVEVWMTVPAIWTEAAKNQTKAAALAAGFASGPMDRIKMISEPEAAAVAILHSTLRGTSVDPLKKGETFVVCDCGGGTVDLTTYKVITCHPTFKFQEICAGEGGKCGSTFVDRHFDAWMANKFKSNYIKLSTKNRGPGSKMMESFEKAKLKFGPKLMDKKTEKVKIENVDMKVQNSAFYDREDHTVVFPCQAAIMTGAVIRGLLGLEPAIRIARLHYGFCCSASFREGIDLERDAWIDQSDGEKMAYSRIDWVVNKGQRLKNDFSIVRQIERQILPGEVRNQDRIEFFSCSADEAPDFEYSETVKLVGYIQISFTSDDFENARSKVDHRTKEGTNGMIKDRIQYLDYDIIINMNSDEGVLTVNVSNQERQMGNATIEFDQE
ncbi:hsp70-like protein [Phyllosticta paracitricarpa]|uniref:Hsp70-like protein n=1 Tax=Phyllosticta paracitricarpa TaxID=2016321 RepID=A0ABR1N1Q9_9PEZI